MDLGDHNGIHVRTKFSYNRCKGEFEVSILALESSILGMPTDLRSG